LRQNRDLAIELKSHDTASAASLAKEVSGSVFGKGRVLDRPWQGRGNTLLNVDSGRRVLISAYWCERDAISTSEMPLRQKLDCKEKENNIASSSNVIGIDL
jgi:hypothetical protein